MGMEMERAGQRQYEKMRETKDRRKTIKREYAKAWRTDAALDWWFVNTLDANEEHSNGPFPWVGTWAAEFADFKARFHARMAELEAVAEQEAEEEERRAEEEEMSEDDGYTSDARASRNFR
ncbi:hypothetical protein LTR08_005069 [Meristemomyces frigidus]|nr:hypothetical protein LTR08_005069 [Meristemomyces frigidus]